MGSIWICLRRFSSLPGRARPVQVNGGMAIFAADSGVFHFSIAFCTCVAIWHHIICIQCGAIPDMLRQCAPHIVHQLQDILDIFPLYYWSRLNAQSVGEDHGSIHDPGQFQVLQIVIFYGEKYTLMRIIVL
jgi:hypothetical protein